MSQKLTVLIICKNEAQNIRDCIESARGLADEILVADSFSSDNTLEIVRQLGCRIVEREFVDFANFKNWAIPQASHPWILLVDADERVTKELAADVREVLAKDDPAIDAYNLRRTNYFLGREIRHCGWNRTVITRVFRRDACRYVTTARVHERLDAAPERTGMLRGRLLHYTCWSLDKWVEKHDRYAAFWAEDHRAAGKRTNWLNLLVRPPFRFLQTFLFRGGILDGVPGLIICAHNMFYTFLKYAMLWQLGNVRREASRESRAVTAVDPTHRPGPRIG